MLNRPSNAFAIGGNTNAMAGGPAMVAWPPVPSLPSLPDVQNSPQQAQMGDPRLHEARSLLIDSLEPEQMQAITQSPHFQNAVDSGQGEGAALHQAVHGAIQGNPAVEFAPHQRKMADTIKAYMEETR